MGSKHTPGPLTPDMVTLLNAGKSILRHHVHGDLTFHCVDLESDDYVWTHEYGDGLHVGGLLYVGEEAVPTDQADGVVLDAAIAKATGQ
jgi:hypothetical protein